MIEVFFRRPIVPHVRRVFVGALFVWGLAGSAHAVEVKIPAMPNDVAQARALLSNIEYLQAQETYKLDMQERACYEKTLISMCLQEVRGERSKLVRGFRQVENHARELVRADDFEQRRQQKLIQQDTYRAEDQNKAIEAAQNAQKAQKRQAEAAARPLPTPSPRAKATLPAVPSAPSGPTASEQSQNLKAFNDKQEQAKARREANNKRLQELKVQRDAFVEKQKQDSMGK